MNTVNSDIHTIRKYEILDAATVFLNLLNRFIQKIMIQSETKLQCTAYRHAICNSSAVPSFRTRSIGEATIDKVTNNTVSKMIRDFAVYFSDPFAFYF